MRSLWDQLKDAEAEAIKSLDRLPCHVRYEDQWIPGHAVSFHPSVYGEDSISVEFDPSNLPDGMASVGDSRTVTILCPKDSIQFEGDDTHAG